MMAVKPQPGSGSAETITRTGESGGYPKRRTGDASGSLIAEFREPPRGTMDLYAVTALEERYGIREEGMF